MTTGSVVVLNGRFYTYSFSVRTRTPGIHDSEEDGILPGMGPHVKFTSRVS